MNLYDKLVNEYKNKNFKCILPPERLKEIIKENKIFIFGNNYNLINLKKLCSVTDYNDFTNLIDKLYAPDNKRFNINIYFLIEDLCYECTLSDVIDLILTLSLNL